MAYKDPDVRKRLLKLCLSPEQNGRTNYFFFNEIFFILCKVSPKFIPKFSIHNNSTLSQGMVWYQTADKP